mmetsp:Transcript_135498/g.248769  ORF Transcript_135498/g.248769 Transcript_135498/m.248769 type:complete len:121 (+) Transcript_135498:298-660(+)
MRLMCAASNTADDKVATISTNERPNPTTGRHWQGRRSCRRGPSSNGNGRSTGAMTIGRMPPTIARKYKNPSRCGSLSALGKSPTKMAVPTPLAIPCQDFTILTTADRSPLSSVKFLASTV